MRGAEHQVPESRFQPEDSGKGERSRWCGAFSAGVAHSSSWVRDDARGLMETQLGLGGRGSHDSPEDTERACEQTSSFNVYLYIIDINIK